MNKTKLKYFDKEDILHVAISDEPESGSIEVSPSITAELNEKGELIEIHDKYPEDKGHKKVSEV